MIELALRRLFNRSGGWGLGLAVLLCLALAAALPAALAAHAQAVSARELHRSLAQTTPADRTLLITGSASTFREELYTDVQQQLGGFFEERLVIRHATLPADPPSYHQAVGDGRATLQVPELERLDVYSFDRLEENVRLVEGRLPDPIRLAGAIGNWPPPMEAIVGARAAEQSGVQVGDRVTANHLYYRLDIVGIVEPLDPDADLWGGDLGAFASATDPTTDTIALPLIIAPQSMQGYLGRPIFPQEISWRVTLDTRNIGPGGAEALRSELINLQNQATTRGATIHTGLVRLLSGALDRLSRVRAPFLLLTVQTLLYVLYALGVIALLVAERARPELALLSARGMNTWQIAGVWAAQHLVLALVAGLVLGPALAWVIVMLWSGQTDVWPAVWLPSMAAAAAGWLLLLLPIVVSARRSTPHPPQHARIPQASPVQKHYLDLTLLAFAGLLHWQLSQSGSFLMRQLGSTEAVDPLLLIGPTLLLVAAAIVFLRVVPPLLRAAAWILHRLRGPALSLALLHAARDPRRAGHLVLLVSLAAGMVLFGSVSGDTLAHNRDVLQATAPIQGVIGALRLSSLTILLFSLVMLILTGLLVAQARRDEFRALYTIGLPARRWRLILFLEDLALLLVGLLVGSLAGWGLARVMLPTLLGALAGLPAGAPVGPAPVDWPAFTRACALLLAVYGAGLAVAWLAPLRSSPQWAGARGEE